MVLSVVATRSAVYDVETRLARARGEKGLFEGAGRKREGVADKRQRHRCCALNYFDRIADPRNLSTEGSVANRKRQSIFSVKKQRLVVCDDERAGACACVRYLKAVIELRNIRGIIVKLREDKRISNNWCSLSLFRCANITIRKYDNSERPPKILACIVNFRGYLKH